MGVYHEYSPSQACVRALGPGPKHAGNILPANLYEAEGLSEPAGTMSCPHQVAPTNVRTCHTCCTPMAGTIAAAWLGAGVALPLVWAFLSPKALPAGYDLYHLNFHARKFVIQNATGPACEFPEPTVSSWTAFQVERLQSTGSVNALSACQLFCRHSHG